MKIYVVTSGCYSDYHYFFVDKLFKERRKQWKS